MSGQEKYTHTIITLEPVVGFADWTRALLFLVSEPFAELGGDSDCLFWLLSSVKEFGSALADRSRLVFADRPDRLSGSFHNSSFAL